MILELDADQGLTAQGGHEQVTPLVRIMHEVSWRGVGSAVLTRRYA